jgi:glycine cleavage system H protein
MHTLFEFVTLTKGVEYLIAVAYLLVFVVFWRYVNVPAVPAAAPARSRIAEAVGNLRDIIGGFLVPEDVYFYPGHAWAKVQDGDILRVGIDDFGQKLLGKVDAVQLPPIGSSVRQGERAWSLKVDGKSIDMLCPVDGKVVAVNSDVIADPRKINSDPFGQGWLLKVHSPRKSANLKGLFSGLLAKRWIEDARARLLANSESDLGAVLTESGPLREGIARIVDPVKWDDLVREFFLVKEE